MLRLQRCLHSILSARPLLNLREASLCTTVLVDGNIVSDPATSTTAVSDVRFGRSLRTEHQASATLLSVDDGVWVDGDPTFSESYVRCYKARAIELELVREERMA